MDKYYYVIALYDNLELSTISKHNNKKDALEMADDFYSCYKNEGEVRAVGIYDVDNNDLIYWKKIDNVSRETSADRDIELSMKCFGDLYNKKVRFLVHTWIKSEINSDLIHQMLSDMLQIYDCDEDLFEKVLEDRVNKEARRIFNRI